MNWNTNLFPDEVLIQILARLPVKSLFRCKSVCKLWYKLSSDRYFIQLFNELSSKYQMVLGEISDSWSDSKSMLICVDYSSGVYELSLDFLKARVKIRASCNGLVCCSSIPDKNVYFVCNPMTREYRLLPPSRERHITRFYPDGEATLVGLACDVKTQKFNVVLAGYHRTFGHRPDGTFICLVFDSCANKWRKFVSLQDEGFSHMNTKQVVFVNGMLHWLTISLSCILALDLDIDIWRKISLPDEVKQCGYRVYLLESNGCLSVVQMSDSWMKLWVLKDYKGEEWTLLQRVSLRCIRGLVPGIFPISMNDEYIFLATQKQVLVYQWSSKLWKEMYSTKNSSAFPLWFSAHAFRSTILSCNETSGL